MKTKTTKEICTAIANELLTVIQSTNFGLACCVVASRWLKNILEQRYGLEVHLSGCVARVVVEFDNRREGATLCRVNAANETTDGHVIAFVWDEQQGSWLVVDVTIKQAEDLVDKPDFPELGVIVEHVQLRDSSDYQDEKTIFTTEPGGWCFGFEGETDCGKPIDFVYAGDTSNPVWCIHSRDWNTPNQTLMSGLAKLMMMQERGLCVSDEESRAPVVTSRQVTVK